MKKSDWDQDPKTKVIKNASEVTEVWTPEFTGVINKTEKTATLFGNTLGTILLQTTTLQPDQLAEALAINAGQQNDEEGLSEILLKKKWITPKQLLEALSLQLSIPIGSEKIKQEFKSEWIEKIPINFAKKFNLIPVENQGDTLIIAISSGKSLSALDDLRILLQKDVSPVLATKADITDAINRAYNQATKAADNIHEDLMDDLEQQNLDQVNLHETQDLLDSEDEAPIIRLINALLFQAVKERASDIHIEPGEKDISVRFRVDGVLSEIMRPPKKAQNSISSRVKIMAQLDIAERRIPQDGRIKIKLGGRDVDIRVSVLPTSFGERIVMRLLDTSNILLDLKDLGFTTAQLKHIEKIVHLTHGIFLVTGPTGSGKSTTLYACISRINSRERNIITVEDPVEIQLQGISQIQVNPKVQLTFASGLRSILRQDPDVVMVGEIRDKETAEIAIQASNTGHLVFSTLHTNDSASSITRLMDMGIESYKLSDSLVGVMAQRLARRLCKNCKTPNVPTDQELKEINLKREDLVGKTVFKAKGCSVCGNSGYKGRIGVHEILPIDDSIKALIVQGATSGAIKKAAVKMGMKTLREDGARIVLDGTTSIEEILRTTQDEMEYEV